TTLGVLFFTIRSMILGRDQVEGFGRSIPWDIVRKSISITFVSGATAIIGGIILSLTETLSLKEILFETTSAVGTVGLSLNVTDHLTAIGKFIISGLMYLGRIGPLTVAFLIGVEKTRRGFEMPMGKIVVG
ncbi:MAG: Trk family potassium uptake protein, partial [Deltaproteobacteria bacterium]|nr:Trk family potassium uptake protein [Deltaproteobacteria bacterium]